MTADEMQALIVSYLRADADALWRDAKKNASAASAAQAEAIQDVAEAIERGEHTRPPEIIPDGQRYSMATVMARIDKSGEDGCWIWRGQVNHHGYAILRARGLPISSLKVTHIMLEQDGRDRPDNAHALHSCDNPSCVNPAHLRWGTPEENAEDRISRGRTHRSYGSEAAHAKLTDDDVRAIRNSPLTGRALAAQYGVSETAISRVKSRKTWPHI